MKIGLRYVNILKKKGNDIRVYSSLHEDGQDQLTDLINELSQETKNENDQDIEEPQVDKCDDILDRLSNMYFAASGISVPEQPENKIKKKVKKCKYRAPEYMIVFDDLSSELKSKSLLNLLKKNRHYKSKLIISSQWLNDILPESRKQMDLWLIFKGCTIAKLQEIYKDCDSSVPFEKFVEIYKKSTEKAHSFLYVDSRADKFRQNFDCEFMIDLSE